MRNLIIVFVSLTLALADDTDLQKFAAGSTQFTQAVYNEALVDNRENLVLSPFSVETILALTQSGAVGTTAKEIRSSLFLPDTEEETEVEIKSVLPALENNQYTLKTANKVYVENHFVIKDGFKKIATDVYQASFENVEFAESVQAAAEINQWVEEQTENKIHNLVAPDDLDENTRVVLVNALYFQGNWSHPFNQVLTKKATFFKSQDVVEEIEMMTLESATLGVYDNPDLDAKYLELPFKGEDASMVIVLPNQKEGIAILEKQVERILAPPTFMKQYVQVNLPKFKVESSIDFKPILQKLGVNTAFTSMADFSGIAGYAGEIELSKVVQKTFIDVNEGGVEAAAATVIGTIVTPTAVPPTPKIVYNVDHPFVFYIQAKGVVLFEGRVLVP